MLEMGQVLVLELMTPAFRPWCGRGSVFLLKFCNVQPQLKEIVHFIYIWIAFWASMKENQTNRSEQIFKIFKKIFFILSLSSASYFYNEDKKLSPHEYCKI